MEVDEAISGLSRKKAVGVRQKWNRLSSYFVEGKWYVWESLIFYHEAENNMEKLTSNCI